MPIIERLTPKKGNVQAIILTPTRELTIQVSDELHSLKGKKNLKIASVYGEVHPIDNQFKQLKQGADIVVGTPGRVIDHLKRKELGPFQQSIMWC